VPALMEPRTRAGLRYPHYDAGDLNKALGCVKNDSVDDANNCNANSMGWRAREHSDYLAISNRRDRLMWFPIIYNWYKNFLGKPGVNQQSRIWIGEE